MTKECRRECLEEFSFLEVDPDVWVDGGALHRYQILFVILGQKSCEIGEKCEGRTHIGISLYPAWRIASVCHENRRMQSHLILQNMLEHNMSCLLPDGEFITENYDEVLEFLMNEATIGTNWSRDIMNIMGNE
jgi:hypothetical protein